MSLESLKLAGTQMKKIESELQFTATKLSEEYVNSKLPEEINREMNPIFLSQKILSISEEISNLLLECEKLASAKQSFIASSQSLMNNRTTIQKITQMEMDNALSKAVHGEFNQMTLRWNKEAKLETVN
eukprot:TRINITY_DN8470_c0_g1_i1.p1 TRINITY_DN8470_c0_g1~~TRINITY_DN8470_c0_g1_i1.p1  ORF type:complete len:140 (+),score=26.29 TRINITY_DN8470_c0_g1_i1:36-422(+)